MGRPENPSRDPSAGQPLRKPRSAEDAGETELSAGGAVLRRRPHGIELVVGHQTDWNTGASTIRLPKGHVEAGETLEQTALREVREEAGRRAEVLERLHECAYAYENLATGAAISKRVVFFLMRDIGDASESRDAEMHDVQWLPIAQAMRALTFDNERTIVLLAAGRLQAAGL